MKKIRKILMLLWTIVALVGMVLGKTDTAIFAMCWAIFIQLEIIEEK